MLNRIMILTWNDLAVAFKNKTVYLIVFIPIFVFLTLKLVDRKDGNHEVLKMGFSQEEQYPPFILRSITSAAGWFDVVWVPNQVQGNYWLKERKLDGLLLKGDKGQERLVLWVLKKESFQTQAIVESLAALQNAVEGGHPKWVSDVQSLQTSGVQKQALPTWILMLVLLVSFIVLPVQVAEEKEKKIILGLLQTPVRESEWLLAKLFLGMILILSAVLLLHALGGFGVGKGMGYAVLIGVGSWCFSAFGILLGCLCRNQSSARTLGVIVYLPFLMPSALSDVSQKLNRLSPFVPSYWFYEPVKSLLLEGGRLATFPLELTGLILTALLTCYLSYLLIKKRWLM